MGIFKTQLRERFWEVYVDIGFSWHPGFTINSEYSHVITSYSKCTMASGSRLLPETSSPPGS